MIEALFLTLEPPAIVQDVRKKKRNRRSQRRPNGQRHGPTGFFVGAIILMTGNDGQPFDCKLTHQTPDGQWWCEPLKGNSQ